MFNGIVETTGIISQVENKAGCKHFVISPTLSFNDLQLGESIAVNGVCLTVTHFNQEQFSVSVVTETLRVTNLDQQKMGDVVNLERSLKVTDRISGHTVQGHVDGIGHIKSITNEGTALLVTISLPSALEKYVVKKGYIALDGMSITVIDAMSDSFTVTFIPHTQAVTIIPTYRPGQSINIEVDILGKYIEKLIGVTTHAYSY